MTGGLGNRIQNLASSPPVQHSLSPKTTGGRKPSLSLGAPETSKPLTAVQGPYFRSSPPSPGVPISWGLPPLWLTSGSLALCGPYLCPLGARTGSRALTSPAAGGARVTAAGASAGSARSTDPHSPAGPPGTRAGSDVRQREGGAHPRTRMSELCIVGVGLSPPGGPGCVAGCVDGETETWRRKEAASLEHTAVCLVFDTIFSLNLYVFANPLLQDREEAVGAVTGFRPRPQDWHSRTPPQLTSGLAAPCQYAISRTILTECPSLLASVLHE